MYKLFTLLAASAVALALSSPAAYAGSADFQKPIAVDARTQSMDGKNKITRFKGNVVITQGSLTIQADEVEVNAQQGQGREIMIARGNPATYSQTMDDGSKVQAQANELRYEVDKRTISMSGNAQIRQNTSMVQGDTITYDMVKEQLLATSSSDDKESRVKTIFRPNAVKQLSDGQKKAAEDKQDNSQSRSKGN